MPDERNVPDQDRPEDDEILDDDEPTVIYESGDSDDDEPSVDAVDAVEPEPETIFDHWSNKIVDEDSGGSDTDVPFHLPSVGQDADGPTIDNRDDEHKMVTMPVFREPGVPDPKKTLPGSGGLDPNPDFVVRDDESPQTVAHQPVRMPPPGPQSTIPNPQTAQPADHGRYRRPAPGPGPQQQPMYGTPPPPPQKRGGLRGRLMPRRRRRGFRFGCLWIAIGLLLTFCGGLTFVTVGAGLIFIPRLEEQWNAQIDRVDEYQAFETTFIYDRYGNPLYEVFGEGRRETVPYDLFPQDLINATISIEDDTFFSNIGIDVAATFVAFMQYIGADAGEQTPGGSSITQQVVRNVLFDFEKRAERSVSRKAEEIILSLVLTQRKSKEEILELYLNEIYYGNLAYGAQAAAQIFFGKDVENLTLGEAALLAGLPQAPAELDPLNPDPEVQDAVRLRWRAVLTEMVEEGYITAQQRDLTLSQGLRFSSPDVSLEAPHFTVYAQGELEDLMIGLGFSPDDIARGGLKVYTTIDQNINNLAQAAAAGQVARLQANNVSNAAVVVIKPLTGEILGMVGSIDYNSDVIDGRVNVTISLRQPGSTMKPFTYSAAIERGLTPGDVIWDVRTEIGIPGQPLYEPRNYDGVFHGPMRMRTALANSYNIPAVQTLRLVGVDYLLGLMHRFGVTSLQDAPSNYGLSLTLGGGEVSLIELTNAYAVFPNLGSYVPVTSILCVIDSNGDIIYQYENSCPTGRITGQTVDRAALGKQVLDPRIAYIMTDILSDNVARSTAMGSRSPLLTEGLGTAVKTGTTNDVKDNWTVGYTRNVAVGVWVGNNDGDPMVNSSGLTGAAPIWNAVITGIHNDSRMRSALTVSGQLLPDKPDNPGGMTWTQMCDVRRLTDPANGCPSVVSEWMLNSPAGIPDAEGNLIFPQTQPIQDQVRPSAGSYVELVSPGVYRSLVFPIPPDVAALIQFELGPGDKQPPPPRYCLVPVELAGQAVGAQEQLFIVGPQTSQSDRVEAERYAQNNNLAYLPTIECWADVFTAQSYGPTVVTAVITSPANGDTVSGAMPIMGTVQFTPEQALYYRIEIRGVNFADWTTLGDIHYQSVTNGQLEWLAAEGLPGGQYQLRLSIIGHDGNFLQQPYVVTFNKP